MIPTANSIALSCQKATASTESEAIVSKELMAQSLPLTHYIYNKYHRKLLHP